MGSAELDNLVAIGKLRREPPLRDEYEGLLRNAEVRLQDAKKEDLHLESRFDLAYAAAHSLAVAALRRLGYRSDNRQIVFQALAHTIGAPASMWRLLAKAHEQRNRRDYEGVVRIEEQLTRDLITAGGALFETLQSLPPPAGPEEEA